MKNFKRIKAKSFDSVGFNFELNKLKEDNPEELENVSIIEGDNWLTIPDELSDEHKVLLKELTDKYTTK